MADFIDNNFFDFGNEEYLIYGAGKLGRDIAEFLSDSGFNVTTIIDLYVDKLDKKCKYRLCTPDNVVCEDYSNCILIITLNNGRMHEKIAQNFFENYGITKIVYLPMTRPLSLENKRRLRKAYIDLKNGNADIKGLPKFNNYDKHFKIIDDSSDKWISFWSPVELLYTTFAKPDKNVSRYGAIEDKQLDIPIVEFVCYKELFRYLQLGSGDLSEYLRFQGYPDRSKEEIISDRKMLYQIYEKEYKDGLSFFMDSPGYAIWDDNAKKIRLIDGYHRAFYLMSRDFREVPVFMSTVDYNKMIKYKDSLERVQTWEEIFGTGVNVFIYGAGKTAEHVFSKIRDMNKEWCRRVKGFLVTDKTQNPNTLMDLPVYQADEYEDKAIRILVPHVAVYRDQIHQHLLELGYKDFVNIAKLQKITQEKNIKNNPYREIGMEEYNKKSDKEKQRDQDIAMNVLKILKAGDPDFGGVFPYQSLELIGLEGERPTSYRISRYGLTEILTQDMSVLDIGCNTGFIDITIANKVKSITGIEYDKSLAQISSYVADALNVENYTVENTEFSKWYHLNGSKKYDAIFSFAIHHWLNLTSEQYAKILDSLLSANGYLWLESHDGGGDAQYFEIIEVLRQKDYYVMKDEAIADDGDAGIASERRFVLMKKSEKVDKN